MKMMIIIRSFLLICSSFIGFMIAINLSAIICFIIGYGVSCVIDRLFVKDFLSGFLVAGWLFFELPVLAGGFWGGWISFKFTKRWISARLN